MKLSSKALDDSYAFCRGLSRRSGSNFYLGFLLLPREKRQAMDALYAFMRHTDDLVDDAQTDSKEVVGTIIDQKREQLHHWRTTLENALTFGECLTDNPSSISINYVYVAEANDTGSLLLPALVDTVKKYRIPPDCLFAVLDGVGMDLDKHRYETYTDLQLYCRRVASAVGLACIHIWGFSGMETPGATVVLEHARKAGIALQLTNILRDLKADAATGRIYLPLEDFRACGYSTEELEKGVVNDAFHRLMKMEINRAKLCYEEGLKLLDFLHRDGRRIFGLMISTYLKLLMTIGKEPEVVFNRQISLGKFQHLLMAAAWATMPSRQSRKCGNIVQNILNNERSK
jgi:15-cis-phytoene synthase